MTEVNQSVTGPRSERAQRWRQIAIEQLSGALNLFVALTVGAIGYWFALLRSSDFSPGATAKCLMVAALVALVIAGVSGLACVVNRVWDIRGSARRAANHPEAPSKASLDALGRLTWVLFTVLVVAFAAGVGLMALAVLMTDGAKLA